MSYRVSIEPMRGRLEDRSPGDFSGLWKVVSYDEGSGSITPRNPPKTTHAQNLSYAEAEKVADDLENKLNATS